MTNKERAEKLIDNIFQLHLMGRTKEVAIKAVLAYADEIRRECAYRAKTSASIMLSKLLTTLEHEAIPMALDAMETDVMGKEAGE